MIKSLQMHEFIIFQQQIFFIPEITFKYKKKDLKMEEVLNSTVRRSEQNN